MSLLENWAAALGGNITGLTGLAGRQQAVKNLIGQCHLLLILDDAWNIDVARAMRVGGPGCRYVLTTRDQALANAFAGAGNACKGMKQPC
jgi:hypothetical protein